VSGYHIREAGATAAQELAFTLADGFAYVELGQARGLDVDTFAPGLSFFFNAHIDFFEEIAKLRAARRIWARWLKDRYGAADPNAMKLRFHTQTAGVSLTAQQPMNNVVRTAIEALAGVLGGTQSLHTNALDEVLALPTEENAKLALRTQQVIAYESGVPDVADPLGGSYFMEAMTDRMEEQAEEMFAEIDRMGEGSMLEGVLTGIERGWFQQAVAESAFREQRRFESGELTKVGVNAFVDRYDEPVLLEMEAEAEARGFPAIGRAVGVAVEMLARSIGARRVFELGSGFGYSAYWFARAVGGQNRNARWFSSADNVRCVPSQVLSCSSFNSAIART